MFFAVYFAAMFFISLYYTPDYCRFFMLRHATLCLAAFRQRHAADVFFFFFIARRCLLPSRCQMALLLMSPAAMQIFAFFC